MQENEKTVVIRDTKQLASPETRRGFLRALGLGGSIVLLPSAFAACSDAFDSQAAPEITEAYNASQRVTIDLSSDAGIFRFATIIEQLEQAFYNQFTASTRFQQFFPAAIDQEVIVDIRNDENVHRTFIDTALGANRLPQLSFDFTAAFASRATFLAAARAFANTGTTAYNGAGRYLKNVNNLLVSGKIVSVEARHAASLLDMDDAVSTTGAGESTGQRFANFAALTAFNTDDANALDGAITPAQAYGFADPYIVQTVTLTNAPTAV